MTTLHITKVSIIQFSKADDITAPSMFDKKIKNNEKRGTNDDITHYKKKRINNIIFAGFGHMLRPFITYPIFLFNIQYNY